MKNYKRSLKLISIIILAVIIIFGIIAIAIKSSNTYATGIPVGTLTYTYTASTNTLAITGTGTVTKDWKDNDNLKSYVKTTTAVTIAATVTGIADNAFEGCTALATVTFKSTSKVSSIGNNAFEGCISLTNIKDNTVNNRLPKSITTIGDKAFSGCTSLDTLNLYTGVTTIGTNVFENCSPTISITLQSTAAITYPISESGVYKIEAHGGQGPSVTVEGTDDERTGNGAKGGKATGYIQLDKNNELKTEFYAGGAGNTNKSNGARYTSKGGNGGKGIGIKLGEEDKPFIAAGGGSGASAQGECSECHEFHGSWTSRNTYDETRKSASTTGENGKKWSLQIHENDDHSYWTYRYIGGAGGGGGYPYGGGTYEGGSMEDCRCLCWILLCGWGVS